MNYEQLSAAVAFSGGGGNITYQIGAMDYLKDKFGFVGFAGISAGAYSSAAYATGQHNEIKKFVMTVTNKDMNTHMLEGWRLKYVAGKALLFNQNGLIGKGPLEKILSEKVDVGIPHTPMSVGMVNLKTSEIYYVKSGKVDSATFRKAILASGVMPIIWAPEEFGSGLYVDGGLRDNSPINEVLRYRPNVVISINCNPRKIKWDESPKGIVQIGMRSLQILLNETFNNDMERFRDRNETVRLVNNAYGRLRRTEYRSIAFRGKEINHYPLLEVSPSVGLGSNLDFEKRWLFDQGREDAIAAYNKFFDKYKEYRI